MRKVWEENGGLGVACFVLFVYFFWQISEHVGDQGATRDVSSAFLLPVSAFYSAHTVVRITGRLLPSVGWWLRGLLRWSSWWTLRAMIAALTAGFIASNIHDISEATSAVFFRSALGIPTLLTLRQILHDYAAARRRFGSLAQAERAFYQQSRKNSPWGWL